MDPRMGAFDAVMYDVEDDPVLRSFITVLIETDTALDDERLRYRVERLTRLIPKMRQRAVGNPSRWCPALGDPGRLHHRLPPPPRRAARRHHGRLARAPLRTGRSRTSTGCARCGR